MYCSLFIFIHLYLLLKKIARLLEREPLFSLPFLPSALKQQISNTSLVNKVKKSPYLRNSATMFSTPRASPLCVTPPRSGISIRFFALPHLCIPSLLITIGCIWYDVKEYPNLSLVEVWDGNDRMESHVPAIMS